MRFNKSHKTTRSCIEQTFGIWTKIFYCLHGELRLSPSRASRLVFTKSSVCLCLLLFKFVLEFSVIIACCVLHNIAIDRHQVLDDEDIEIDEKHDVEPDPPPQRNGINATEAFIRRQGFAKRARITQNSF